MSDRLDDKITAFVVELVDDPPPVPDLDVDAAPSGQPLESAVTRFRLRGLAVAVAAFVAVVVAVGVVALVPWRGGIESQQSTTVPPTTLPPTTLPPTTDLSARELLQIEHLPAGFGWKEQDVSAYIWDKDVLHPLTVHPCYVGVSGVDHRPYKAVSEPPLSEMTNRVVASFEGTRVGVTQAVYADTRVAISEAFGTIVSHLEGCLNNFEPTAGFTPQAVEEGSYWEANQHPLPQFGDEAYAITFQAFDRDGHTADLWMDHTMAVVRSGERLTLIELYEGYEDQTLTGADFNRMIERAAERLGTELLTEEDLPGHSDWQVFDETSGADSIAGWGIGEHGVLAVRCDEGLTAWRLDPSPRSADLDKPWVRLDNARFRAMYVDMAVFGEALYSSTPETVTEAFEMMKSVTLGCLTSPLSSTDLAELLAMRQVGGDTIAPDIEASAADEAELLAIPPVGDNSIAIKVKWYLSRSQTVYDIFRLAIVRDGTRLLIVEEHETVRPSDAPPRVTDAEFVAVVQTAANRLKP